MIVPFVIIALVASLSLYDYFTARRWQQITSNVRNEIVFEQRNRAYGAYVLRRDYDKRLVIILFGFVLFLAIMFASYVFVKNLPKEKVNDAPKVDSTFTVAPPPKDETPPPPPPPAPPATEKMVKFIAPVVVDEEVVDEVVIPDENIKVGPKDIEGDEDTFLPPEQGEEKKPDVVEDKPEEVLTFVEEDAEYPGGYPAMMKYIQDHLNYPPSAIELGIQGKVTLKFVVEKNGQVSNVSVVRGIPGCAECDKEAVKVVSNMPGWKSAKNAGKQVRQWNTLPISFALE
jgi:protein TonB